MQLSSLLPRPRRDTQYDVPRTATPYSNEEPSKSGVRRKPSTSDDWFARAATATLVRALNTPDTPKQALDELVLYEWLAESLPNWQPMSHSEELVSAPEAVHAPIGHHDRIWVPVLDARPGLWVVRVDQLPSEAVDIWTSACRVHRFPMLARFVSESIPGVSGYCAVAEVAPPRWRPSDRGEPSRAMLLAAPCHTDRAQLTNVLSSTRWTKESRALANLGITSATLQRPEFYDTYRVNRRGHALFPYTDGTNKVGLAVERDRVRTEESHEVTPWTAHGIWHSRAHKQDRILVVTSRPIDALAYQQLRDGEHRRFVAVHRLPTAAQVRLLTRAAASMPQGSEVVLATPGSLGAEYLHAALREICKRHNLNLRRDAPTNSHQQWLNKGWSDLLAASGG